MYGSVKDLTAYFGEDWDANDPSRVLRVVRDFMNLFNKAHQEIEVCVHPHLIPTFHSYNGMKLHLHRGLPLCL